MKWLEMLQSVFKMNALANQIMGTIGDKMVLSF